MKNKSLVYMSIFISIIYFSSCRNEVKEEVNEKDFYLTETENIDKIIMSDKAGNIIKLEKEEKWILNSKYPVMEHQIERTLEVMKDLRIKSFCFRGNDGVCTTKYSYKRSKSRNL